MGRKWRIHCCCIIYRFRKPLNAHGKWKLQVREALTSATKTAELP